MAIIENMSNEDYHKHDSISKSGLDLIALGPSEFIWSQNAPREETKAFELGNAGHAIICEPKRWTSEYVQGLDIERRSNADKASHAEFEEENKGKFILKADEFRMVGAMRDSIMAHPAARMIIENADGFEQSFINTSEEFGIEQRCRLDINCLSRGIIADLKFIDKIENASKHIHEYRYHVQDSHYTSVVGEETGDIASFVFIFCGKARSGGKHPVRVVTLSEHAKEVGASLRSRDMAKYAECKESGNWIEITEIDLPGWVK